jgi:hypothetical protein
MSVDALMLTVVVALVVFAASVHRAERRADGRGG